jgi:hypothetical protein
MAEDAWKLLNSEEDKNLARNSKSLQTILSGNSKGKVAQLSTNITTTGRATFLSSLGFTQPINSDQATTQSVSFSALNEAAEDVRRETRAISSTLPHLHDVKDADELSSLLARDISALNDDSPVVRRASLFRITVALFGHDLAMMAEDTSSIVTLTSSTTSSTSSSSTTLSFSANATAAASLSSVSHSATVSGKAVQLPEGLSSLHVNVDPAYIHASFELSDAAALIMGKEAGTGKKAQLPTVDGTRKDGSGAAGDGSQSSTFTTSIAIAMSVSPIAHYANVELSGGRGNALEHAKRLLSSLWAELYKPLIKRFFDSHEACRVGALALVAAFLTGGIVRDLGPCLPYLIPALTQKCAGSWVMDPNQKIFAKDLDTAEAHRRGKVIATSGMQGVLAGTERDIHRQYVGEVSEPCRLLFARVLFSLLRSAISEGAMVLLDAYLHEIIMCAHALSVDPFPDLRVVAAPILIVLADSSPHALKHYAVAILRSLSVGGLDHRHAKVRLATLDVCERLIMMEDEAKMKGAGSEAITHLQGGREANTIPVAAFYGRDTTINYMAKLVLDSNATVRLRFAHALGAWMTRLSDRYDYWSRLMPYMLSLLSDPSDIVITACLSYLDACGVSHEIEHAKVIMEKRQFGIDGDPDVDYDGPLPSPFSLNGRPRLGVRLFVRANSTRFVKPILRELADWAPFGAPGSIDMRSRAASLLTHVLTYQEEFATQDVHGLVGALVGTIHDGINLSLGWNEENDEIKSEVIIDEKVQDIDIVSKKVESVLELTDKTSLNIELSSGDLKNLINRDSSDVVNGSSSSVGYHMRIASRLCGRFLPSKAWLDVLLPIIEADEPSIVYGDKRGRGDSEILASALHVLWLALGESELRPNRVLSQIGRVVNAICAGMPLELNLPIAVATQPEKAHRQGIVSTRKRLPELCCVSWSLTSQDRIHSFTRRVLSCINIDTPIPTISSLELPLDNNDNDENVTACRIRAAIKAKAIAKRQVMSSGGVSADIRTDDSSVVGVRSAQGTWPASFGGIPHRFVARSHLLASLSFCSRILKGRINGLQSVVPGGEYLDPKRIIYAILGAVLQVRAHIAMDTIEGRSLGWKNNTSITSKIEGITNTSTQSSQSPSFSYSIDIGILQPFYEYNKKSGLLAHGELCDKILIQLSYLFESSQSTTTTTTSTSTTNLDITKPYSIIQTNNPTLVPPLPERALPLIATVHSTLLTDCLTNYPTDSCWSTQNACHRLLYTLVSDSLLSHSLINAENVLMMIIDLGRSLCEAKDELGFSNFGKIPTGGVPPLWREALCEWLRLLLSLSIDTFTTVFSTNLSLTNALFGNDGVLCSLSGRLFFNSGNTSSGNGGALELTSLACELICRFSTVFETLSRLWYKNKHNEEKKLKNKREDKDKDKDDDDKTLVDSDFFSTLSKIEMGLFTMILPRLTETSTILRSSSTSSRLAVSSNVEGGRGGRGSLRKDVYVSSFEPLDVTIARLASACSSILSLNYNSNENFLAEQDTVVLDSLLAPFLFSFTRITSVRIAAHGVELWAQIKRYNVDIEQIKNSTSLILRSLHALSASAPPGLCSLSGIENDIETTPVDEMIVYTNVSNKPEDNSYESTKVDVNNKSTLPSVADHILGALYALSTGGDICQEGIKLAFQEFLKTTSNYSIASEITNLVLEHLEVIRMMRK